MFSELKAGKLPDFKKHLNQYDVIHLDIQWCMMDAGSAETTVKYINEHLIAELQEIYPEPAPRKDRNGESWFKTWNKGCKQNV